MRSFTSLKTPALVLAALALASACAKSTSSSGTKENKADSGTSYSCSCTGSVGSSDECNRSLTLTVDGNDATIVNKGSAKIFKGTQDSGRHDGDDRDDARYSGFHEVIDLQADYDAVLSADLQDGKRSGDLVLTYAGKDKDFTGAMSFACDRK